MQDEPFNTICHELLNTISSGVAVYDVVGEGLSGADYIVVDFNRAALEHEGKRREEVVGMRIGDLRPGIEEFGLLPVFHQVWKTGEPGFHPARIYTDDTFAEWYENRVFRLSEDRIVAVYDNVTERHQTTEALEKTATLLREVLDSMDKAIAIYEPVDGGDDFVFVGMNKAAEPLTHYRVDEVVGRRITELFPGEPSVGLIAKLREALDSGEVVRIPLKQYKDKRITQWVENTIFSLPSGKVVAMFEDSYEEHMAERAREENDARYRLAERIAHIGNWEYNIQTEDFRGSEEAKRIFGIESDDDTMSTEEIESCIPERERTHQAMIDLIEGNKPYNLEFEIVPMNGAPRRTITSIARLLHDENNEPLKVVGVIQDVTETRERQEQLRQLERRYEQSQKLETVGRLAGGIAHDFNNLLTIINGHSDLICGRLDRRDPLFEQLAEIRDAGERAAALTRQLLAFSRKQVLKLEVLDLNKVIRGVQRMVRRILGEDIEIETSLAKDLGHVNADSGQLEQVLMNLAVNARDAMPEGGELRIETENVDYEGAPHAQLCVVDNGAGMSAAVKARLFEPFFTTKAKGQGTGLGLATVYGIIKQIGGEISVESEPGEGTSFQIHLPQVEEAALLSPPTPQPNDLRGSETILVVEDERAVRELTRRILEGAGYTVLAAKDGAEALDFCSGSDRSVDLLLTDVIMPRMSGRELADRLGECIPELQTVYMSGYTDDAIARHGVLEGGISLLPKPFTSAALLDKVREALDRR